MNFAARCFYFMNSNWRNRPTTIDYLSKNIDYIISIDESGNSDLSHAIRAKNAGTPVVDSERHFTITACAIETENFGAARDMVMDLKYKYWTDGLFSYKGKMKRVCFHSREIRGRKEAFNPSLIDYEGFITDLSNMMAQIPMTLYASHIDKQIHVQRYTHPISPYDLCMNFILERVVRDIGKNKTCVIVLESRGAREDKALLEQIKSLLDHGNNYYESDDFSNIKGVYFNPKWSHLDNDCKSYWELELADLCAYPIQKYFVYGNKDMAFQTLLPKISCYPNIEGRGIKSFP